MSAIAALKAARAAGLQLRVEDSDLVLEASAPPPSTVLNLLSLNKAAIVAMLQRGGDGWSAEDWHAFFDERAGIEFDGALSCPHAEERAFTCCVVEWLDRNPVSSMPGRCLGCGGSDRAHDPLLPYGIETTGFAWLHRCCWPIWHERRMAEAVAALAVMGIESSAGLARPSPD